MMPSMAIFLVSMGTRLRPHPGLATSTATCDQQLNSPYHHNSLFNIGFSCHGHPMSLTMVDVASEPRPRPRVSPPSQAVAMTVTHRATNRQLLSRVPCGFKTFAVVYSDVSEAPKDNLVRLPDLKPSPANLGIRVVVVRLVTMTLRQVMPQVMFFFVATPLVISGIMTNTE